MILDKEQLEQIEAERLAPYALKSQNSKGRQNPEPQTEHLRTNFQLDRDRIIHTKAFRRLKGKTQVLSPQQQGDHYRDRLTHTLEVAQISRGLARNLGLNEDAAEAIALAHDLGHPPFGHMGEYSLDRCLLDRGGDGFEHNEQSYRLVLPLNLSLEVMEGLEKHKTPFDQVSKKFVGASLEAQLVNLGDEIAYLSHDIEDGLRLGVITAHGLKSLPIWQSALLENPQKPNSALIKLLLADVLHETQNNIEHNSIKTLADVYAHKESGKNDSLVAFSPVMREQLNELREFLFNGFYMNNLIQTAARQGQEIIQSLFDHYFANPSAMPSSFQSDNKLDAIRDYISGMTDRYAREQWRLLISRN